MKLKIIVLALGFAQITMASEVKCTIFGPGVSAENNDETVPFGGLVSFYGVNHVKYILSTKYFVDQRAMISLASEDGKVSQVTRGVIGMGKLGSLQLSDMARGLNIACFRD